MGTTRRLQLCCTAAFMLAASTTVALMTTSRVRRRLGRHAYSDPTFPTSTSIAGANKKRSTASEQARFDEEGRRRERANDVVIGKTSAQPGAKDYELDISATTEEWMRQASALEQKVFAYTERGMEALKSLQLTEAEEAFGKVFELRNDAYLWQAGIVKFYNNDLEGAADVFARCARVYETKFNEPASEERIWRHACELKLFHSMGRRDRQLIDQNGGVGSLLAALPVQVNTEKLLRTEMRKAMRVTCNLFAASVHGDHTNVILSRAQLRSMGGGMLDDDGRDDMIRRRRQLDVKLWKVTSWYYLGLHYDTLGMPEESRRCMKTALRLCPNAGKATDLVHTLPLLHMVQRDWFDDDDLDRDLFDNGADHDGSHHREDDGTKSTQAASTKAQLHTKVSDSDTSDRYFAESVRSSIAHLRLVDLREALQAGGERTSGSKEVLQKRLFDSLMGRSGFAP